MSAFESKPVVQYWHKLSHILASAQLSFAWEPVGMVGKNLYAWTSFWLCGDMLGWWCLQVNYTVCEFFLETEEQIQITIDCRRVLVLIYLTQSQNFYDTSRKCSHVLTNILQLFILCFFIIIIIIIFMCIAPFIEEMQLKVLNNKEITSTKCFTWKRTLNTCSKH